MSEIVIERIRETLGRKNIGGFFISRPVNVKYVSGYTGEDSYLLITADHKYFITDPRYTEQVSYECPDFTVVEWRKEYGSIPGAAAGIAEKEGLKSLAFESDHLVVDFYRQLEQGTKAELIGLNGVVEELRSYKTPKEIEYLRASCEIASRAYERIQKDIRVGITEKELAANLSRYMVLEGSDTMPYGNILISGARTSLLHGIPSEKAIEYGDLVLMDYGCTWNGLYSDMSRTVFVGGATERQKEAYALVRKSNESAEAMVEEGAWIPDIDKKARDVLDEKGYAKTLINRLGHGIGYTIHEAPDMKQSDPRKLERGMAFTIEPGIYLAGDFGIRIEDVVVVNNKGEREVLNKATKDLIIL